MAWWCLRQGANLGIPLDGLLQLADVPSKCTVTLQKPPRQILNLARVNAGIAAW